MQKTEISVSTENETLIPRSPKPQLPDLTVVKTACLRFGHEWGAQTSMRDATVTELHISWFRLFPPPLTASMKVRADIIQWSQSPELQRIHRFCTTRVQRCSDL